MKTLTFQDRAMQIVFRDKPRTRTRSKQKDYSWTLPAQIQASSPIQLSHHRLSAKWTVSTSKQVPQNSKGQPRMADPSFDAVILETRQWLSVLLRLLSRWLFKMPTELITKCGENLIGKVSLTARSEPFIERGRQHRRRHTFIDSGFDGPASFS